MVRASGAWSSVRGDGRPGPPATADIERGGVMNTDVMFLDCPAYMDKRGAVRGGLPAEVEDRYTVRSTDGPMESARIRCPRGHWFNGPVEFLTWSKQLCAEAPLKPGLLRPDVPFPPPAS